MSRSSKKRFAKRESHKMGRFLGFLAVLVFAAAIGAAVFVARFDLNAYGPSIAATLTREMGRTIEWSGPIKWSFSFSEGAGLSLSDVTVGNPSWASRHDMARIGRVALRIDVRALLEKRLDIIAFDLSRADAEFEIGPDGSGNWVFASKEAPQKDRKDEEAKIRERYGVPESKPVSMNIRGIHVSDSRFGWKGKDGKLTLLEIPDLLLRETREGSRSYFKGRVGGVPAEMELVAGKLSDLTGQNWPFSFQAFYGGATIDAKGRAQDRLRQIVLEGLALKAGDSKMVGDGTVELGGQRPFIKGRLQAAYFDPADFVFKAAQSGEEDTASANVASGGKSGKLFSREPLPLDGLKALDADIALSVQQWPLGVMPLRDVKANLSLKDGKLLLSPLSALTAGSKIEGQVKLDAAGREAQLSALLYGKGLEFGKLFDFAGIGDMISGKVDLDMNVATSGRSSYDFAAQANGKINLLMGAGTVSSGGLQNIAGGLVDIFLPGVRSLASPGLNCLAARYQIANGLLETKGLLIDMDNTTVAGFGTINLPDEHINMSLRTRPKGVGLGAIVPPMKIYGSLTAPSVTIEAGAAIQKVADLLTSGGEAQDMVPKMLHIDGKNDCAVTLDNPVPPEKAGLSSSVPLVPGGEPLKDTVQELGGKILEGIGKSLFGN